MGYYTDLSSGAGLAFAGSMVEVIGTVGNLSLSAQAALTTLGTAFLGVGVIIIGFGLYERFFTSKLSKKAAQEDAASDDSTTQ
ncbi:MAG: hypothetical protein KGI50_06730 [Patescibacteria group bacterium]|nr:hypothetical protein [Patescibacteria group bacterium]MDE2439260.1 hypothetical protein [Patescibacteria group bacterium]